ncbi:hypothetical protein [Streptomyces qinzhouensis]|uniref:Uncharacterized protein n=1 Tax=Streptomyces qinzhouensis TaxID=2599401 RepID=A0A5B8ILK3_9ACTN|nr:hypothetical protein [Streptomyces qinzhouensis]QDY79442.1 hypothetical protein FQU76_26215 [Streptomyces qinzhouensis]
MGGERRDGEDHKGRARRNHQVRVPGFVREEEIGLGDLVSRATRAVGVAPCGGCTRRARRMNEWVTFTKRRR